MLGLQIKLHRSTQFIFNFKHHQNSVGHSYVDSISLGIAAISINTMKANIYYSKDSNFTSPTQINYSTGDTSNYLSIDSLLYVGTSLNDTDKHR